MWRVTSQRPTRLNRTPNLRGKIDGLCDELRDGVLLPRTNDTIKSKNKKKKRGKQITNADDQREKMKKIDRNSDGKRTEIKTK